MKVGILSFAHLHAEAYIQNLHSIPDVELIGIADDDQARGTHYAAEFGAHLFGSYAELLAARPDAVLVCSENSRHRALVEQAAAAGAHVLCEKPLATSLADAQAMIAACERASVLLMTAFPMRFSAPLRAVKARLDAGELGQVYCFNAVNQGQLPMRHRAWFVDPVLAGGGAVLDHTVHLADLMRWYLGSEVVEVYAQTNRIMHAEEVAVETGGLLLLTFANGVFASIDCSWSRPDGYPTWGGLALELISERGALSVDAFRQNLHVYGTERLSWDHWGADANQAMVESFLESVRSGRPPAVSGADGAHALAIALAAYESARTGQPVPVGYTE